MNTGFSGAACVQAALALVAVILVLNPLTMTLFVHMSFTRTVYLLLFDALAIAVAFYALRHFRDGHRRDLIGAIVLLVAIPVLMLLAEPAIATLDGWVNDGELAETRADDAVHRPDTLAGWVPVPNAIAPHAIEGRFDVTYELDESGRKAIPKNPGAERTIHFFGDSFTFGFGVSNEDTALNLVARALGERANVANWAVMGYGLEQIFLRLRDVQEETSWCSPRSRTICCAT